MHWWRHHYTREVQVEPQRNTITIWFAFPRAKTEQYANLIPSLQIPWVQRELERHRAVLAENGLGWHIDWRVREGAFEALNEMPASVESYMLTSLSKQKHLAAQKSRVDILKHFDRSREQILDQLKSLKDRAQSISPVEYLQESLRMSGDLWELGSRLTARDCLRSALFFTTKNGRSVPPPLHVRASIQLAEMNAGDRNLRDALVILSEVREIVRNLEDGVPEKVRYFQAFSSSALRAGFFQDGSVAAHEASRLLPQGPDRERIETELVEAKLLAGAIHDNVESEIQP